jgi:hypothetical protein
VKYGFGPAHKKHLTFSRRACRFIVYRALASKLIFLFLLGEEPTRRSREKSALRLPIINIISAAGAQRTDSN